jgi:pimeloyl-ACP methyl ester carboxylesterase
MVFHETGEPGKPVVILIHGGGLSDWSWREVANGLKPDFHVVMPVLDGHGEAADTVFESIEAEAETLLAYVDEDFGGHVYAACGLSIGAQIVVEMLARRKDIATCAVVESALLIPMPGAEKLTGPMLSLSYGLIKNRWFARMQAKSLCIPEDLFETYFQESQRMSRQSLANLTTSNSRYTLKPAVRETAARVLILVGGKELGVMRKSAQRLHEAVTGSELRVMAGKKHGETSLRDPVAYTVSIKAFISGNEKKG